MKKLLIISAVLLMTAPALAIYDGSNSDWTQPFANDQYTMALYHMDETPGSTIAVDSGGDTAYNADMDLGNTNGWYPGVDPFQDFDLDPQKTWVASQAGFGNAASAWYNNPDDRNVGALVAQDGGDLSTPQGKDHTIEFWMNPNDAGGGWGSRLVKHLTGGDYAITYSAGVLSFGYYKGAWLSVTDTTVLPIGQWTHVAITQDNESLYTGDADTDRSIITFWLNGAISSIHVTAPGQAAGNWNAGPFMMFNDYAGGLFRPRQYNGLLDEVRISNVLRYQIPEPSIALLALGALALFRKKQ